MIKAFYSGYGRVQNYKTGKKDDETIYITSERNQFFYLLPCDAEKLRQIGFANIFALRINNDDNIDYIFRLTDSKGKDYTFDVAKDNNICIGDNNDIVKNTLKVFFYDDTLQPISKNSITPPADNLEQHPNKSKSQKQHAAILEVIKQLGYDRMSIPDRKKPENDSVCRENEKPKQLLFGVDGSTSFDNAWKSGRKLNLFKMANHYNYAKRDK